MKSVTETRVEAEAAVDALRERVARLEEENGTALAAVETASVNMTKALVDGKAPDEKRYELALEERDRAARRLVAAKEALSRAETIAGEAGAAKERADAKAALAAAEAESVQAQAALPRALREVTVTLGVLLRVHHKANAALAVLGPQSNGVNAPDPTSWHFISRVLDEVYTKSCEATGALNEAARLTVQLRIPRLPDEVQP